MPKKNPRRTDKEWLDLIQECRSSGLSDKCWCQEHHIHTSNFYYQIRRLRQKACEIPEPVHSSFSGKQEVVQLSLIVLTSLLIIFVYYSLTGFQFFHKIG